MVIPHANIMAGGRVIGTVSFLGSEIKPEGMCHFLVSSKGIVTGFTAMCEGFFNASERMFDMDNKENMVFLGKTRIVGVTEKSSVPEKIKGMNFVAQQLGERVNRQIRSQSR